MTRMKIFSARGVSTRSDTHPRFLSSERSDVESAHRALTPGAMVGPERLHFAHPPTRAAPRRHLSIQPAKRRGPRDVGQVGISRNHRAGALGIRLLVYRREGQPDPPSV